MIIDSFPDWIRIELLNFNFEIVEPFVFLVKTDNWLYYSMALIYKDLKPGIYIIDFHINLRDAARAEKQGRDLILETIEFKTKELKSFVGESRNGE